MRTRAVTYRSATGGTLARWAAAPLLALALGLGGWLATPVGAQPEQPGGTAHATVARTHRGKHHKDRHKRRRHGGHKSASGKRKSPDGGDPASHSVDPSAGGVNQTPSGVDSGPAEPLESPTKVTDAVDIRQVYVTAIDNDEFRGDAPEVTVDVTADDPHDSLLLYTTSQPCASTYQAAAEIFEYEAHGAMVIDAELGAGTLSLGWRSLGGYGLELTGYGRIDEQPGQDSTLCAMLYDATGDPPQSLYPDGIPQNHVWLTAQAPIPTDAP
jgi:hypothetical protein